MHRFFALIVATIASTLLSGCAYRNNYPDTVKFPIISNNPAVLGLYVDANGTFFPDGWRDQCGQNCKPIRRDFSLLKQSISAQAFRAHILTDEARQIEIVKTYLARHRRIFILVHGFNTNEEKVRTAYALVRKRVALQPDDGVIEFFWDGLVKVPADRAWSLAPLKFWRDAAVNSQTGGARGLRRILALAQNRTLVLISHSRGASVVLSALSNPPYREKVLARIERRDLFTNDGINGSPGFLNPAPLPSQSGNKIKLLMLAPAIGCIDFQRPDFRYRAARTMSDDGCKNVRPLPPEVDFFGYTVNEGDIILGKSILPSSWYEATDFGYKNDLGFALRKAEKWDFMQNYDLANKHGHDFRCYAADAEFGTMLTDAGALINPSSHNPSDESCIAKIPKPQPKP